MTNVVALQDTNTLANQAGYFVVNYFGLSEQSYPAGPIEIPLWRDSAYNVHPHIGELPNHSSRNYIN